MRPSGWDSLLLAAALLTAAAVLFFAGWKPAEKRPPGRTGSPVAAAEKDTAPLSPLLIFHRPMV